MRLGAAMKVVIQVFFCNWTGNYEGREINVLITGATGLVGRGLCAELGSRHSLTLSARRPDVSTEGQVVKLDLLCEADYRPALQGIDVVIHTAALVHRMNQRDAPTRHQYFQVNAHSTEAFARAASESGVKHFIFLSTIKVLGESTSLAKPLTWDHPMRPDGPYAESKAEAERLLMRIANSTEMSVTIIRPPLVYGPGVKANFESLMQLSKVLPAFPYDPTAGRRSLVSIWNLCDFIKKLVDHEPKNFAVYHVSDGSDCSTFELLQFMSVANKRRLKRLPIPVFIIRLMLILIGKRSLYLKIFGGLQVDIEYTTVTLNWRPQHNTKDGINRLIAMTEGVATDFV